MSAGKVIFEALNEPIKRGFLMTIGHYETQSGSAIEAGRGFGINVAGSRI
jgi:hypothetical protein